MYNEYNIKGRDGGFIYIKVARFLYFAWSSKSIISNKRTILMLMMHITNHRKSIINMQKSKAEKWTEKFLIFKILLKYDWFTMLC